MIAIGGGGDAYNKDNGNEHGYGSLSGRKN
jgi:hypothetical protein